MIFALRRDTAGQIDCVLISSKILHKVSTGIRDEIIKALEEEIRTVRTIIVIISKIKLPEKIMNLLRK